MFVLLKGKVALEISVLELFLTELIIENLFSNITSNEIVALLSSVVYQAKSSQDELTNKKSFNNIILDQGRDRMIEIALKINRIQSDCEIQVAGSDDYVEQLNFGLVEVVYEWSKGTPFATIKSMTNEQEGIIVRTIQRLDETCSNLKDAAKIIGDSVLVTKMENCSTLIRRDIVFAGSLYTKPETK
jgi:antiviral helicase SKI2